MSKPSLEVPSRTAISVEALAERLARHPELTARVEALLAVIEDAEGDLSKADAAEQRVVEELQQMGQTALQSWASRQNQHSEAGFKQSHPTAHRTRKKTSTGTVDSVESKS